MKTAFEVLTFFTKNFGGISLDNLIKITEKTPSEIYEILQDNAALIGPNGTGLLCLLGDATARQKLFGAGRAYSQPVGPNSCSITIQDREMFDLMKPAVEPQYLHLQTFPTQVLLKPDHSLTQGVKAMFVDYNKPLIVKDLWEEEHV